MATPAEGSEDVSDFLRRIKELGDKRDQEDTERNRKLEEEIMEGRRQREARRAERARSLSPEKPSPAATPKSLRSPVASAATDAVPNLSIASSTSRLAHVMESPPPEEKRPVPAPANEARQVLADAPRDLPRPPSHGSTSSPKSLESPFRSSPSAAMAPSRAGTLSWQQRPSSVRGSPTRPRSVVGSPLASQDEFDSGGEKQQSRADITKSLESRDPSWFKQTAERGVGSAAFRKSQQGGASPILDEAAQRQELHGLGRGPSMEPEDKPVSLRHRDRRFESPTESPAIPQRESQRLEPTPASDASPLADDDASHGHASFGSGRRSPERATSPTKGMGGFVQSAMLRRTESVSKRWSAQPSPSHARQGSRSEAPHGRSDSNEHLPHSSSQASFNSIPEPRSPDLVSEPAARPGSAMGRANEVPYRPSPRHSRTQSTTEAPHLQDTGSRSASPSKRWSRTKSSWLENALKQQEVEKPKPTPPSNQPAWLVDLNKKRMSKDIPADVVKSVVEDNKSTSNGSITRNQDGPSVLNRLSQAPETRPKPSRLSEEPLSPEVAPSSSPEAARDNNAVAEPVEKSQPLQRGNSIKAKPSTPPKKDFRTSLKSVPTGNDKKEGDNLEFKNALGALKRTKTQKYEAPDVLKDNISRGKAGLAVTGGPQKTQRKDEFKESLISQKDAMKTKAAETKPSDRKVVKEESKLPEALAKRRAMASSSTSGNTPKATAGVPADDKPEQTQTAGSGYASAAGSGAASGVKKASAGGANKFANKFNPGLANLIARGPRGSPDSSSSPMDSTEPGATPAPASRTNAQEPTSSKQLEHMTKGRARGPRRKAPTAAAGPSKTEADALSPALSPSEDTPSEVSRSLPTSEGAQEAKSQAPAEVPTQAPKTASRSLPTRTPSGQTVRSASSPRGGKSSALSSPKPSTTSTTTRAATPSKAASSSTASPKPQTPTLSRKVSSPRAADSAQTPPKKPLASSKPSGDNNKPSKPTNFAEPTPGRKADELTKTGSSINATKDGNEKSVSPVDNTVKVVQNPNRMSVRDATARWSQKVSEPTNASTKEPIKLPTRRDEERAHEVVIQETPATPAKPVGLGIDKSGIEKASIARPTFAVPMAALSSEPGPIQSASAPLSPGSSPALPTSTRDASIEDDPRRSVSGASFKSEGKSPIPQTTEAAKLFHDFFGETPIAPASLELDTAAILSNQHYSPGGKIKTLRKSIVEITGDGKTQPLSQQQEYMLFDSCMYLVTHVFGDSKGARLTEVYLWTGAAVPDTSADDVLIFAKKVARDVNGTLVVFRRGKETPNFFQALGGIVITRTGPTAASPSDSFMLCGRRHLGHIAFDEVPLQLSSFCSAFSYIISPAPGKLLIWKGRGSHSEETTCAKIIAMDLGPAAEVTEVDEGQETTEFLAHFPTPVSSATGKPIPKTMPRSAEHWKLKPAYEKYRARLFSVEFVSESASIAGSMGAMWSSLTRRSISPPADLNAKITVRELESFTQADLEPEGIYVLDAFFEVYVLPGALASKQASLFAAALHFAQDYGILAASSEDRPYVPMSTIVMQGAPRDMKASFRGWDDKVRTEDLGAGKKRGALKIVSLSAGLAALGRPSAAAVA